MGFREYLLLATDFVILGYATLQWTAWQLNVHNVFKFFDDYSFPRSVVDLSFVAVIRCATLAWAMSRPRNVVAGVGSLDKLKRKAFEKALWSARFAVIITVVFSSNFILAKGLSLLVSDTEAPVFNGTQTVVLGNHFSMSNSTEDEVATATVSSYWTAMIFGFLITLVEYKLVRADISKYEIAILKQRRALKKSVRHLDVSVVSQEVSALDSTANTPLLGSDSLNQNNEAPTTNSTPSADIEEHDSSDDSSDDDAEMESEYQKLLKNTTTGKITEGMKMRLKERMHRINRRKRKKRREKEDKKTRGAKASIGQLLAMCKPDILYLLAAFVFLILAAISASRIPMYTGQLINNLSHKPSESEFYNTLYHLVIVSLAAGVFAGARGALFTLTMARLSIRVRKRLFESLLEQEVGYYDQTSTGDITSRLSSDTTKMADQISLNVNVMLRSMVEGVLYVFLMLKLSWKLALLSFISVPFMSFISSIYGNFYRGLTKSSQDALADANSIAEEALGAITTVRDFSARRAEMDAYKEELQHFFKLNLKQCQAYFGFAMTWASVPSLVTALTLYFGGKLVLEPETADNHLLVGDLYSFMLYQAALTQVLGSIAYVFTGMASALGAADKVFVLMNRTPKIPHTGSVTMPDDEFVGTMEIKDVVFRYPARPQVTVLNGLSLKVPAGQVVALVGPSGGGKSSCLRLFQHYYAPDSGSVTISGVPVADFDEAWIRKHVAIVGQEPTLFARSIRRNIIYGLEGTENEPSQERIEEAAKMANAHDFIMEMPKGYKTEVGERGVQLSGGQKQRIALARSLVRNPQVLLLDEATSALDAESEAIVQAALDRIMRSRGRTVLVIAHRLSTVRDADNIVVISGGKVVEQGTHDYLVQQENGVYANLVQRQLQGDTAAKGEENEVEADA